MRARRAAGAAAAAALGFALAAGQAAAADPILSFAEVRPGMVGEARTVVQGTDIVTFPVRVLDLQNAADSPGGGLILARAEGPLMRQTGGVAQGMSGSPVYVRGADGLERVIGAIAYGTGDQEGVIVGITPIEQMLAANSGRRQFERPRAPRRTPVRVADRTAARALEARERSRIALYPLSRWSLSGASRPAAAAARRALAAEGVALSAIGPRTLRPRQELVPGATMAVLLAGGDLSLGGIGTVTYVDGPRVIGFGHPFLGAGRARFLLGDGYVFQTIAAPIGAASYKLAEPGTVQGAIVGDRSDGVTARLGPGGGIPAVARAHDVTRGARTTVRARLAPDERMLALVTGILQTEPALRVRDGIGGGTLWLQVRVHSPALAGPLVYRNMFAAAGDVISPSSAEAGRVVAMLTQNGISSLPISRIQIDQRLEARVRQARLVSARVRPEAVRPGQRAVLELRVAPWRSGARTLRVPIRVPSGLKPGPRVLRVRPNTGQGFDPNAPALEEALGAAASHGLSHRPTVAAMEARASRLSGPRPRQVARATLQQMGPRNDAVRVLAPGRSATGQVVPVGYVVTGGAVRARVRVLPPG